MTRNILLLRRALWVALPLSLLEGCNFAPVYKVPTVDTPGAYKELTAANFKDTEGWKIAQPRDNAIRGKWWEIFDDPQLNALEEKVNVSNQTIVSAAANFRAAVALVKEARAELFPTVTLTPSITTSRFPSKGSVSGQTGTTATTTGGVATSTGGVSTSTGTTTEYTLPLDISWQPDLWGSIRNAVASAADSAQASAADLENTRLTIQEELAADYFQLRGQDELKALLEATVKADQTSLDETQSLFQTGIDVQQDVDAAESLLASTQEQAAALGVERAEFEHAIATLIGQPASSFSIPYEPLTASPPAVPFGVPSELLERRPDVAADERLVAQANAQIGIARAAFFPTVILSASAGFESTSLGSLFSWPNRFFSIGPSASETLFDGGLRQATVEQDQAQYEETVANYRQTVLTAFQQVEDNLASLRILSQELEHEEAAVDAAKRYLAEETNRYDLGIDPYLNVLTAETTLLADQQIEVTLRINQMMASGALIQALGGGWDTSQLPTPAKVGA